MSMLLAALMFIPLLAIAIAHFLWSIGRTWPLRNRDVLIKTVYGRPGAARMPNKLLTFVVALGILGCGVVALALADHSGGGIELSVIGVALGLIFIARGGVAYHPRWRAIFSEEPFATLDRKNYGPLCLFLGAGYLILVLLRFL